MRSTAPHCLTMPAKKGFGSNGLLFLGLAFNVDIRFLALA